MYQEVRPMKSMKITKFVHACLLVETPDRVALFDPGNFSAEAVPVDALQRLDDIFITHVHPDHCDPLLIKKLVARFPKVRVTSTPEVVARLAEQGIKNASDQPPAGVTFFDSPHESKAPLMPEAPQEIGIHYLDVLSHPGDSHHFHETKQILALPVTAPWGTSFDAMALACQLRPKYVLPIHDWHWRDEARDLMYARFETVLAEQNITFLKLQTGVPVEIDL
jgi:L-ascorbate metabolism protein UlaG (beta-lactamase superfamily)